MKVAVSRVSHFQIAIAYQYTYEGSTRRMNGQKSDWKDERKSTTGDQARNFEESKERKEKAKLGGNGSVSLSL